MGKVRRAKDGRLGMWAYVYPGKEHVAVVVRKYHVNQLGTRFERRDGRAQPHVKELSCAVERRRREQVRIVPSELPDVDLRTVNVLVLLRDNAPFRVIKRDVLVVPCGKEKAIVARHRERREVGKHGQPCRGTRRLRVEVPDRYHPVRQPAHEARGVLHLVKPREPERCCRESASHNPVCGRRKLAMLLEQ